MKTKPHHPIKGKEKDGDPQVVHESGGIFNCYVLLMAKTMSRSSREGSRLTVLMSQTKSNCFSCETKPRPCLDLKTQNTKIL